MEEQILEYIPYLNNIVFRFVKTEEDAEDLIQETIYKAIRYKDNFSKNTQIKSWLYTIMKNIYINEYRKKHRTNLYFYGELNAEKYDNFNIRNSAISNLNVEFIWKMVNSLKGHRKESLILYLKGKKYKEISEITGLHLGTVKTNIRIYRQQLQKKLKSQKCSL